MLTPPPDYGLRWLLLDLNSYFASVEQQVEPRLRGRPIAIVPMDTDYTCAIAASYEAKAYGIKTGTSILDAKQMCPDLICVQARHDVYVEYHHKIIAEFVRHTPLNKVWSIDEMNSRLVPGKRSVTEAAALAHRMKKGLRENVGECIRASIGVATNSFLAKTASDMQKPDGLVLLEGRDLPGRLFDLRIDDLCGIGPNMRARLNRAGIWSVRELWALSPKQMRGLWHSVEGERFWYRLHGWDIPEVQTGAKSIIGHSRVMDTDSRAPDVAMDICRRLTVKACQRLRRHNLYATKFYMSVRDCEGRRWGGETRLHPANDTLLFVRATHDLWASMAGALKPARIKKVSVSLAGLQESVATTGDLFEQATTPRKSDIIKSNALSGAMDKISKSFGPHALHFGNQPQTSAGFVGTKIAFARVPDMEEFRE